MMKTFNATVVKENMIELTTHAQLEELYETITGEEQFILRWKEGNVAMSRVCYANALVGKVKNGDLILQSKEGDKK